MAEREAERPRRALGGCLGMGMLAWDDAADELCSQLMCEGRLWRPSAEWSSLTPRVRVRR